MHEFTRERGNVVRVRVSGKLTQEDYDQLIPLWEETLEHHGTMRMLLVMENFEGWEPRAAWDDFRFSTGHAKKIERVAMVGEKAWQKWMAKVGSFFLPENLKYFDMAELAAAESWLED